jgi:heterodisulfide reductase subunit D
MDTSSALKKYEKDIYLCTTCRDGACGILCPSFEILGFESNTPRGRMRIARGLLEGRLKITDTLIKRIYSCTGCEYCTTRCSNNPHDVMLALRSHLIETGEAHAGYAALFDSLRKNHNPTFQPHEKRFDWLPEELRAPRKADILLFAGCYASFQYPWILQKIINILDHTGVNWTTLGTDEWCCGEVAEQIGREDLGNAYLKHNIFAINRAVKDLGVSTVVTKCPDCARRFKFYPERLGLTLEARVLHVTELYSELIKEGKLRFKESKKTYVIQDACGLGRRQGVYEAPREIIKAIPGAKLVETGRRARDFSQCCSGDLRRWGGCASYGIPLDKFYHGFSEGIVRERLKSVKASGGDTLVSVCSGCHRTYVRGTDERGKRDGIDLLQITTLVADLMN